MSLKFKPTRYELLKLNRLLNVAFRGSRILQQRYRMLNQRLLETRDELKRFSLNINRELLRIYGLLDEVGKELGEDIVKRAAAATIRLNDANVKWVSLQGIMVPEISYTGFLPDVEDRGYYPLETNEKLDRVAEGMHRFFTELVSYINLMARQRILVRELKKVERRSKALDHVLIPSLVSQRKRIISKLEEIEREELVRKKRIKELLESRG